MRHRLAKAAVAAACCILLAACDYHLLVPSGAAPWRYRDAVFSSVTVTEAVPYGKATAEDGSLQTLLLDVYRPAGDTVTKRPAIVWVHGGGFRSDGGERDSPEIVDEATTFAKQGYVGVSISYRLYSQGCTPVGAQCTTAIQSAWHDAQAAVRFLRAKASTYKIDVDRIAIAGTSAGGITAYNVAYGSDQVGTSGNPGYSSKVRAAVALSGASLMTSPDAGEPPTFGFHGTDDDRVPYQWVQNTVKDAEAAGLRAELTTWTGDGHVPYAKHRAQILAETSNFLYATMDLGHAAR